MYDLNTQLRGSHEHPGAARLPHAHRAEFESEKTHPGGTISANFLILSETLKAIKGIFNANVQRCRRRENQGSDVMFPRARALLRFSTRSVSPATWGSRFLSNGGIC